MAKPAKAARKKAVSKAAPPAPPAAENEFATLSQAALEAEESIRLCMRELTQAARDNAGQIDLRNFSLAVSTLRRIVDLRAVLRSLRKDDDFASDSAIEAELMRALEGGAAAKSAKGRSTDNTEKAPGDDDADASDGDGEL